MSVEPNETDVLLTDSEALISHARQNGPHISLEQRLEKSPGASKEISRLFFDHVPVALAMFDREMRYLAVSKRWMQDFSLGDRDIIGISHYEIFPEIPEGWKLVHRRCLAGETIREKEDRLESADGTTRWMRWEVLPWNSDDGAIGGIVIFSEDITRYKQTEIEIRGLNAGLEQRVEERTAQLTAELVVRKKNELSLSQFEAIIESSDDAIVSKTLDGIITSWNGGAERMFGYNREEALGQSIYFLIPEEYRHEEIMLAEQIRSGILVRHYETVRRCKDGRLIDISVSISPLRDRDGHIVSASKIARDITERKMAEAEIRKLAFYDPLTQLANRRMLDDRLSQAVAASQRNGQYGALMFFDLDNFKSLNDKCGHDIGDLLLIEVAHRIGGCVRRVDTVARFGGDEFVVMLSGLDKEIAISKGQGGIVAEKIRAALAKPYLLTSQRAGKAQCTVEHHCTASIGVALFIGPEIRPEDVLKWADNAMYQAKAAGGNLIRFYAPES